MKTQDAFLLSLLPESSHRMQSITGGALVLGLCLSFWFGTFEFLVPETLFVQVTGPESKVTLRIPPRVEPPKTKTDKIAKPKPSQKAGAKVNSKGKPNVPRPTARLNVLTARISGKEMSAYELFKNSPINKDIAKVLRNSPSITRQGHTVLGEQRGRADGGFNKGFGEGGTDGISDVIGTLMGGAVGTIGDHKIVGKMAPPRMSEITLGDGGAGRSAAEIMHVVRSRTPGLRHIYNKHLKLQPGIAGKVTLRFTILPGGAIAPCEVASHTTGSDAFAEEIRAAVATWTFKAVKSGNTTVSIPFAFSE